MSREKRLASFCRLCLIRTQNRVQIFGQQDESNLLNLLSLIELDIDATVEPEAVLCYDCIVTLEGFQQFKEQCHTNDEYLKTIPPKDSAEGSVVSEEEPEVFDGDYLLEEEDGPQIENSEEEGRLEEDDWFEEPAPKRKISMEIFKKQAKWVKSSDCDRPNRSADPLEVRQSSRARKSTAKVQASSIVPPKKIEKPKRKKLEPLEVPEPAPEELQPLKDSYPDYFHFEKSPRSLYYTIVYYGERFNSAIYSCNQTYWQCAYKRKFHCPAVLTASNDYTDFERRYQHTHGDQKETGNFELFTPKQALPDVFRIAWQKLAEKKLRREEEALERSRKEEQRKEKKTTTTKKRKQQEPESEEEFELIEAEGDEQEPEENPNESGQEGEEEIYSEDNEED